MKDNWSWWSWMIGLWVGIGFGMAIGALSRSDWRDEGCASACEPALGWWDWGREGCLCAEEIERP